MDRQVKIQIFSINELPNNVVEDVKKVYTKVEISFKLIDTDFNSKEDLTIGKTYSATYFKYQVMPHHKIGLTTSAKLFVPSEVGSLVKYMYFHVIY